VKEEHAPPISYNNNNPIFQLPKVPVGERTFLDQASQTLWTIPPTRTIDIDNYFSNTTTTVPPSTSVSIPAFIQTKLQENDDEDLSDGEIPLPTFINTKLVASDLKYEPQITGLQKRKFAFEADNIDLGIANKVDSNVYRPVLNDNNKYREKINQLRKRLDSVDDQVYKARQVVEDKIQQRYYRTLLHADAKDEYNRLKYSPKTKSILEAHSSAERHSATAIDTVSPSYILKVHHWLAYNQTYLL
jgi:hypothetical protein